MILVTGATGNVGSAVVDALRSFDAPLRTADRHPGADPSAVAFDFTDPATWTDAFAGVESMFLVRPPALGNVRRDLLPAVAAARAAGVHRVVFLSLQGAEKNKVVPHAKVESWLRSSGLSWTFVRASFFHQNLSTTHAADIRERSEIVVPAGNGATAFVDAVDVGAVAAAALLDAERHHNRAWTVTGPRALTYAQVAEILSAELGRPVRYAKPGVWRYARSARRTLGMPWPMVAITSAIYTTARLGLAAGLTDDARTVLGRDPIDFAAFAHRERAVWMPPQRTQGEQEWRLAVIGGTGATGRLLVEEALTRGHELTVLVRDPGRLGDQVAERVRVVVGDATDPHSVQELISGADAVVSALGPTGREADLHTRTARVVVDAMRTAGLRRFVGISGAGIDVPWDRKAVRDKVISKLIQLLGGGVVKDKPAEYAVWAASGLEWTLVRPPRLGDGPATAAVEHDAHRSTKSTKITRADLAGFLLDVVENEQYVRQAPFVASR